MLLIAGGQLDPNLQALADAAQALDVPFIDWRVPKDASPPFHWDLSQVDGRSTRPASSHAPPWGMGPLPRGAFIRQDVFAAMTDARPEVARRSQGWYAAVQGWLMSLPGIRVFNAEMSMLALNKPAAMLRARQAGLRIPHTWLSNDTALLRGRLPSPTIAKPVAGGGLCQTLDEALASVDAAYSAMPALIQPRLVSPELRLFIVGEAAFAFEVKSASLDYRAEQDAEVTTVPVPHEAQALRVLMKDLRMDFGAADFKTDPDTGELCFLELNTSPMFAHFNQVSEGRLAGSMVRHLAA